MELQFSCTFFCFLTSLSVQPFPGSIFTHSPKKEHSRSCNTRFQFYRSQFQKVFKNSITTLVISRNQLTILANYYARTVVSYLISYREWPEISLHVISWLWLRSPSWTVWENLTTFCWSYQNRIPLVQYICSKT